MPAALSEYLSRVAMDDVSVVVISSLFPCYIRHMVKRELLRAVHGMGGDRDPDRATNVILLSRHKPPKLSYGQEL